MRGPGIVINDSPKLEEPLYASIKSCHFIVVTLTALGAGATAAGIGKRGVMVSCGQATRVWVGIAKRHWQCPAINRLGAWTKMKMQMRKSTGIAAVATQPDGLPGLDMIADPDKRAVLSEMGIGCDGVVRMPNFHPIRFALAGLTIVEFHSYFGHNSGPRRGNHGADRHHKIIGISVGTLMTSGGAIGLADKISEANRIRKNIG